MTCTMGDQPNGDGVKVCECEDIMKNISNLNNADKVIVRMLHKKCAVINRARNEMKHLDEKFNIHLEELKRREMLSKKIWRKKFGILILAGILFTAWFFIMYGVILGSLLCSKAPSNCKIIDSLVKIPGLSRKAYEAAHNKIF